MTIDISDNTPRIFYAVAAGVTQTAFTVPFEFFADADLNVYVNDELKSIIADYTVSGGDGSVGTVYMSVTGPKTVALTRDTAIERVTDFQTGAEINRAALNTQLDILTAMVADVKDQALRAIHVSDPDTATALELPSVDIRANKVLMFDPEGNPTVAAEEIIGNLIIGANFKVDSFTGTGSQTVFVLSVAVNTKNNTQVHIDGVYQNKSTYSILNNTLTFSEAPPLGASIEVVSGDSVPEAPTAEYILYNQAGSGSVTRTVQSRLRDFVSVKDFGAVGDGVTDDTVAIQAAINAAAVVVTSGSVDLDQITASVIFPAGKYRTTAAIELKNGVQLHGAGSSATWILVDHSGNGFFSPAGNTYFGIQVYGMHLESGGSALDGFVINGQIRNCFYHDVGGRGFRRTFSVADTWTIVFDQCYSFACQNHFYLIDVGGIHIYHGRYDVASDHGIYMDSASGELLVQDASIQFGSKSAVYVKNCYTVELNQCFFEGNCIGSTSDYYVYISNDIVRSLTSASVTNCVINNLSDPNRDGLGVLFVQRMKAFTYLARWTRNNINPVPQVGADVPRVNVAVNGSNSLSTVTSNVGVGSSQRVVADQEARPYQVFGQDMADASFAPTTRAAMNVGFPSSGLALGTYSSVASVQAYGSSSVLKLNPALGDVSIGTTGLAKIQNGTNNFSGRFQFQTQITSSNLTPNSTTQYALIDCSAGNRSINMANIVPSVGATFTFGKRDASANLLTVTPPSGTINGAATLVLTAAYGHKTIICDGTNWFVAS